MEVSKLSFAAEYGPKLKEDYVLVKHLPKIPKDDDLRKCCGCPWFSCCKDNWQKVIQFYFLKTSLQLMLSFIELTL